MQLTDLKGIGKARLEALHAAGICSLRDLLYAFPVRYRDASTPVSVAQAQPGEAACLLLSRRGEAKLSRHGKLSRVTCTFADETGRMSACWFNQPWMRERLNAGTRFMLYGRVEAAGADKRLTNPSLEKESGVVPVYRAIPGVPQRLHQAATCQALEAAEEVCPETLPQSLLDRYGLWPCARALRAAHAPASVREAAQAQRRFAFEDMLLYQAAVRMMRDGRGPGPYLEPSPGAADAFWRAMPFAPTKAQRRTLEEIARDVAGERAMARMVQGDVGSGKTLVALMAMLLAADNGFQACMMVPTEILARQHFVSITKMVEGVGVRVAVLTGSTKKRERDGILEELASGGLHILIGTHALIEERVKFDNLGLVVIDEQHRFGVEQRARMWTKNSRPPHVLVMTATPIPRTLAMTLYGDLDVSVIDELPPGRKPILTRHLYDSQRMKLFGFLRSEIARGRQVYVVYPLIKESEKMDYKDLYDGFETMSREFPLPQYRLSVVHGKLPAEEKEEGMRAFREGTTQIMVATSVIEVGVDVPNATVMVIESAERFGLSQLHQLRGRVGRGGEQSYCILMSGDRLSREARARLDAMVETNDGFRLSELDLKLRGAGDIGGTQQSGTAFELKIASLAKDAAVVEYARRAAEEILAADPSLTLPENALLARLKERYVNRGETDFGMIS